MRCLLNDEVIFTLANAIFFIWAIYVFLHDKGFFRKSGMKSGTKRGETSWGYFHAAFGFLAVFVLEVINTTEAYKGYKTFITLIDLAILVYFCYFSSWFRNKIVWFVSKSKEMIES